MKNIFIFSMVIFRSVPCSCFHTARMTRTTRMVTGSNRLHHKLAQLDTVDIYTRLRIEGRFTAEHVVPRTVSRDPRVRKDMHLIFPTVSLVNSHRSDYKFGDLRNVSDSTGISMFVHYETGTLAPWDDSLGYSVLAKSNRLRTFYPVHCSTKGIIARSCAYFFATYGRNIGSKNTLIDFELMRLWSAEFPASDQERLRNDRIFHVSKRSNQFVESPEALQGFLDSVTLTR